MKLALILGSGLDVIKESFPEKKLLQVDKKGVHRREVFIAGHDGLKLLLFSGRKHFYEGFSSHDLILNVRLAKQYGVQNILITNAAGGLSPNFKVSDMMLINSHVNLNQRYLPLKGARGAIAGVDLRKLFLRACLAEKILCWDGVYCYFPGPAYETNAEIRMLRGLNADAVGMSTVPEILEASRLNISVLAVSIITNLLREDAYYGTTHHAVLKAARKASNTVFRLVTKLLLELN